MIRQNELIVALERTAGVNSRSMSTASSRIGVGLLGGFALVACSSGSGSSVSAGQAAADAGKALCAKIDACTPFLIEVGYGTVATCASRVSATLLSALQANGTGWTPSSLEACVQAIPNVACDDALGNNLPTVCQPVGMLATGAACGDNAQCSSSYCNLGSGGKCGTCAAKLGSAGTACYRDGDCAIGTICEGSDVTASPEVQGTCMTLAASGATCDDKHPCSKTLACNSGTCSQPAAAAATCSQNGTDVFGSCNELAGAYCSKATNGVCTTIPVATTGQPCGLINGVLTTCSASGTCVKTGTAPGACVAPGADFGNCDATNGPGCQSPAQCIAGVCTLPTPTTCH